MEATQKRWKQAVVSMAKDFSLFGSLCMARFIVWRALRRHRKETASGLGAFRLNRHRVMLDTGNLGPKGLVQ